MMMVIVVVVEIALMIVIETVPATVITAVRIATAADQGEAPVQDILRLEGNEWLQKNI
jgi:hypothetical protein